MDETRKAEASAEATQVAPEYAPQREFAPGQKVIISALVVRQEPGGALVVRVGPVAVPGHPEGYVQTVALHDARMAEAVDTPTE